MKNRKRGSIADFNTEKIKAVIGKIALRAFADTAGGESGGDGGDEPTGGESGGKSKSTINYEDLIAKARQEEKQKQYKTIERLKTQVATLTEQHNNDLLKVADLDKQLKAANEKLTTAGSGDSEEIKTLKATIKSLEGEKADLDKKVKDFEANKPQSREEIENEVRAELEKEYEVKTYKATKLAELKDQLLVPELVMGESKEDIDASIEAAIARSDEIRKSLGIDASAGGGKDTETPPKNNNKGRTPKSKNPSGGSGKEIDINYLASLDVRSPEYAEARKKLGLR